MLPSTRITLATSSKTFMVQIRSLRKERKGFAEWYRGLWRSRKDSGTPSVWNHVVQIGDPCLRLTARPVAREDLGSELVRGAVAKMADLLGRYDAVGISAPQVGLPARIVAVRVTAGQLAGWPEKVRAAQGMEEVPLKVLANPELRVTDNAAVVAREGCCSMHGYSALVPRAAEVEVRAVDASTGEDVVWECAGWTARMLQHEVDHLDGRMFVDSMQAGSLEFNYWQTVNARGGDFRLGFGGISGVKHRIFPFNMISQQSKL